MANIGDVVKVDTTHVHGQPWNGFIGTVIKVDSLTGKLNLQDDKPRWRCTPIAVVEPEWCHVVQQNDNHDETRAHDFSRSGLGIGGINDDQTLPIIPSVAAIERVQRMHDTDIICTRCGASKNFDGAMFTTGGGDICDDCF